MAKEIIIALIQCIILILLYPLFFGVGLYARTTRKDKFKNISRIGSLYIFPAFDRWYLPMIYF